MRSLEFLNKIFAVLLVVALVACVADTATLAAGKGKKIAIGAAAGAGVGGLAKGKKGALLGGTAGAAGGYAYHRMTKERSDRTKSGAAKTVGASAVAGGAAGGLMGGKKGAIVGGAIGGVGGYLLDKKMKKNHPSQQ